MLFRIFFGSAACEHSATAYYTLGSISRKYSYIPRVGGPSCCMKTTCLITPSPGTNLASSWTMCLTCQIRPRHPILLQPVTIRCLLSGCKASIIHTSKQDVNEEKKMLDRDVMFPEIGEMLNCWVWNYQIATLDKVSFTVYNKIFTGAF